MSKLKNQSLWKCFNDGCQKVMCEKKYIQSVDCNERKTALSNLLF